MKKVKKIFTMVLTLCMFIPSMIARAATADALAESLKKDESLKSINATVTYEDNTIELQYNMPESNSTELVFSYDGNVIEYKKEEVKNYEEAAVATSYMMYATKLMQAALELNGYTEEQIQTFFQTEGNELIYDVNGMELKELGESKEYKSEDETMTITFIPMSIKIDVSKANLNSSTDHPKEATSTTIADVVNYLENDENFRKYESDGQLRYTNDIYLNDDNIEIDYTYYTDHYYRASFPCENDIITYEVKEINNYDEAEEVLTHYFFLDLIMRNVLKLNGYTSEEIQAYFESEENTLNYETNGIEIKSLGEEKKFSDNDGSTLTINPMSVKIDLTRANLNKKEYKIIKGDGQKVDKTMSFEFDIDYDTFASEGKVYIDDKEVSKDSYDLSKGSTIVTFKSNYIKTLENGNHTFKATINDGAATATFTMNKTNNPKTGDNIMISFAFLGVCIIGLIGTGIYMKKKGRN